MDGLEYEAATAMLKLDTDWVKLILEAKDVGISIEDIRQFLNKTVSTSASHVLLAGTAD